MVQDQERVSRSMLALEECLIPGGVHAEMGVGSGIFLIKAAKTCRKVYGVEIDPEILSIAQANIQKSGFDNKIDLILGDATKVQLPEKADTIFSETMSIWLIDEPMVPIMNHARENLLKPDGQLIPSKIINLVELGHLDFNFHGIEVRTSIPQFTGIIPPRIMTTSHVFSEVDFTSQTDVAVDHSISINSLCSGIINCARLTSIVQFSPGVVFYSTDSLMPRTIVPLQKDLRVEAGQTLSFRAAFRYRSDLNSAIFDVKD